MARNITIRFNGGPQNGAILYYPYTRDIDAIVARYAKPLVGHYEVVRKSDSGLVIDVRWNDGSTGKQLPKEDVPARNAMIAGNVDPLALAKMLHDIADRIEKHRVDITSGGLVATMHSEVGEGSRAHVLHIQSDINLFFDGRTRDE